MEIASWIERSALPLLYQLISGKAGIKEAGQTMTSRGQGRS